jgi:hypothetical protein
MTKSSKQQAERYDYSKNEANKFANNTYSTYDQFANDLNNYIGTLGNKTYDGDMHDIHKSGSGWDQRGTALGKDMVKGFEDYQRKQMNQYLSGGDFAEGWQKNIWTDQADDAGINSYISDKYNSTLDQLDRAMKRGAINQYQYDLGLKDLGNQRNVMDSNAQLLGQGVLDRYRNDLTDKYNDIVSYVNGADTDGDDSPDDYTNAYSLHSYGYDPKNSFNTAYNEQQNLFDNALLKQLQDLGSFDISQLIADAKVASGINNSMSNNLLNAIEDRENRKDQQIGLGNQGMF